MSWSDWTSGDWLGKWMPAWTPPPTRLPEAIAESVSRLADVFGFSPAAFLHNLVSVASSSLAGRRLETVIGGEKVLLVLDRMRVEPPHYGPLVGQYGEVQVDVHDLRWRDRRIDRITVRAENVHLEPGVPTTLVAAPVMVSATLDQPEIAALLAEAQPRVDIGLVDGVATARLLGREGWGHVEIVPSLWGESVRLQPLSVVVRGHRFRTIARLLPRIDMRLPPAPLGGRFTAVAIEGDRLRLDAVVDQWREPLQPSQLQDLDRRIRRPGAGTFRLDRTPPEPNSTS